MRPDDPLLDADLTWLDDELEHAGATARRLNARAARPSGAFEASLRQRLVAGLAADIAADGAAHDAGRAPAAEHAAWSPVALEPRVVARRPAPMPRARWALVAAAALTAVVAA